MKWLRILALLLVALVVAFGAGCGGDDGGGDTTSAITTGTTTEPADTATAQSISVSMDEFSFDPKDVTVRKGGTIEVTNEGAVAHNLTIEQGPDPTEKTRKLAGTSTFLPGKSESLDVNIDPGKYAIVCTVSGHRDSGMVGTITVK
jgi:plastocyanin